ncbi:hypothetical protein DKX38_012438 [Salix brachista]|uniref:Uncharacterized protein n=1 Tax=Salix brachista TaxID=2182728 RepID=A0A5N5LQU8_9ROSI|nr:hypothetical protein DKX38_012438 [Salix brachista]
MRPISCPFTDFVRPTENSEKLHPLGARKRSSFNIANAFASSRNPSNNVHKPISYIIKKTLVNYTKPKFHVPRIIEIPNNEEGKGKAASLILEFLSPNQSVEIKLETIMASFIIHKPRRRSPFTRAALKTVSAFIKACKEQIDILKNSINDEEANTKGWLGIKADTSNTDTVAHKNGEPDDIQPESLRVLQQVLDDETRSLQVEVTSLLEAVQQTENKMVEMSALNHLISTHVLQQAQQIELLYEQVSMSSLNT